MLWRIFGVAATSTGPFAILYIAIAVVIDDLFAVQLPDAITISVLSLLLLVYVISRIGLVVLVFYSFSSMPVGVYETVNWLQFLPHFS
jgi:hypothetical protein